MSSWPHTFATQYPSVALSWLDDQFNQISSGSTSTVSLAGGNLVGYSWSGNPIDGSLSKSLARIINVKDKPFSAKGDGTTDDTNAIQSAVNAGGIVVFPDGTYVYSSFTIPVSCYAIVGQSPGGAVLYPSRSARSSNSDIISCTSATSFIMANISHDVQDTSFTNVNLLHVASSSGVRVMKQKVTGSVQYAFYVTDSSDVIVNDAVGVGNNGGFNTFAHSHSDTQQNTRIIFARISVTGTHSCVARHHSGTGCITTESRSEGATGPAFPFGLNSCYYSFISNNYCSDSQFEAFQITDCFYCTINENHATWSTSGQDFGISINGTNTGGFMSRFNKIIGNTIINSYKSGLAIANFSQYNKAIGNVLRDCGVRFTSSPITCYTSDYAGASAFGNAFEENTCVNETGNVTNYVQELQGVGMTTTDNEYNWNKFAGTINGSRYSLVSGNSSKYHDNDWVVWSPTVTSGGGTLTSYTVNSSQYKVHGKEVAIQLDVTITDAGTGSVNVQITLPFAAATNSGALSGKEIVVSGVSITGQCGSTVALTKYDNTFPGATGSRLVVSGIYRMA